MQLYQRVCSHKLGFEVGQWADAEVIDRIVVGLLVDHQRDEETQLADLDGNRLDVDTVDAVLYQIEFAGIVGPVDTLIETALYISHYLCTLLISGISICLRGFADSVVQHHIFPHLVVRVDVVEDMHHLLQHAHREGS